MSKRKDIIRIGSEVEIVNPAIVLRWGYPLTKQIAKDTLITQEQKDSIYAMIMTFRKVPVLSATSRDSGGVTLGEFILEASQDRDKDKSYKKVLDIMAYEVLCREHFGGRERQLFTQNRESLRGMHGQVTERKVVKTGKYYPASGCGSSWYDDYDDFEPACLANEKTHVLFRVHVFTDQEGVCPNINREGYTARENIFCADGVWFEKTNLKLPVLVRYYR